MKIGAQVYVRGSVEAANTYCRAFGAEITLAVKAEDDTYAHCELSVGGNLFMAVSEAPADCERTPGKAWQAMAFNVYEMGSEEAVKKAYDILREGGTVIHPLGPRPWNPCCADVVDKYGVFWWIAV